METNKPNLKPEASNAPTLQRSDSRAFPPLLSLTPYKFLPATNGGHLGLALVHRSLAKYCADQVVGTENNKPAGEPFTFHPMFAAGPSHYLPLQYDRALVKLGKEKGIGAVLCEHPYMALTAQRVARQLGVKWFLRSHNIESQRFRGQGKKWWPALAAYEKWAVQQSAGTFFVTAEDAQWAVENWKISAQKCFTAPYGTPLAAVPARTGKEKKILSESLGLNAEVPWFYFLGALDYGPNAEALQCIITEVLPRLRTAGQPFEMLLAGKGLSPELEGMAKAAGICITGFLPSLNNFLGAVDVMLNPVLSGGGIKTKAVEALAWGNRVASCESGAAGLIPSVCGGALQVSADRNWDAFAQDSLSLANSLATVPPAFYDCYNLDKVAEKMLETIYGKRRELRP